MESNNEQAAILNMPTSFRLVGSVNTCGSKNAVHPKKLLREAFRLNFMTLVASESMLLL